MLAVSATVNLFKFNGWTPYASNVEVTWLIAIARRIYLLITTKITSLFTFRMSKHHTKIESCMVSVINVQENRITILQDGLYTKIH